MKQIQLDKGKFALVDDSDYEWLSKIKWRAHNPSGKDGGNFYALTGRCGGAMHRLITHCPDGFLVDHINRDTLDNRRSNLRICTHTENVRNTRPLSTKRSNSRFLGVDLDRAGKKWVARISFNSKKIHLGTFNTEVQAATAYDFAAINHFGKFANLNFKNEPIWT